jgi:N-acetylglucosamine-6-phosphate deacetylase
MTTTLFGRAFVGGAIRDRTAIVIDDDQIATIADDVHPHEDAVHVDGVIVPGFIDVHVHGGDGADFMDASEEAVARVASFHARHGTTALAATTLSGSREAIRDAVSCIAHVARLRPNTAAEICGIHLEGPYINIHRAGAQNVGSIRPADIHEVAALLAQAPNLRWIITLAPELEGARALIEHFKDRVLFSIGHTAADYAEAVLALQWGAAHFTHLFNAMTGVHHREPGTAGAALVSPDATAELIADGIHVHPAILRMAAAALPKRIALVTDAVRAAGMPDGTYKLYEHEFSVTHGAARLGDGTLAGSVLTMQRAVQNMVELAGLPIEMVLPLATEVPARLLGISDRKGRIAAGYDADLVVLSPRFDVERVWLRGHEIKMNDER